MGCPKCFSQWRKVESNKLICGRCGLIETVTVRKYRGDTTLYAHDNAQDEREGALKGNKVESV